MAGRINVQVNGMQMPKGMGMMVMPMSMMHAVKCTAALPAYVFCSKVCE